MFKKLISIIMVLTVLCLSVSVSFEKAEAVDDTVQKLAYLLKKYPAGKYWNHMGSSKNNPEGVTDTPCSSHSNCDYWGGCSCNSYDGTIQCMGYANQVSYEITGVDRMEYEEYDDLDITKLRVGDIIRLGGHSVCVTGVNGRKISITDCNYGARCIIGWRTEDLSWFTQIEYVLHLKGNERTNTNVDFYKDPSFGSGTDSTTNPSTNQNTTTQPGLPEPDITTEIWKMADDSSLNVRRSPDTASEIVGSVPAGQEFSVFEKSFDGDYLWARIKYADTEGYSVLNFASYISGAYETPEIENLKPSYPTNEGIDLSWNSVSGSDGYSVELSSSDGKLLSTYEAVTTSFKITDRPEGKYTVRIIAKSRFSSSWKIAGKTVEVKIKDIPVSSISLRTTGSLAIGETGRLVATVSPSDATNPQLTWTSSDKKVATVDADGTVTALSVGTATIRCKSNENGKIYADCSFAVKPSAITTIQTSAGTTENSVGLKWTKSRGASGYTLYYYNKTTEKYVKLAEGKGHSYTVRNLRPSTTYTFVVRPFTDTASGRIKASFESVDATTTPSKITKIQQTGSDTGRVRLQWEKKEGIYAYVVYKYDTQSGKFRKVCATTDNVIIDTDKTATKLYYRIVTAVKTGDGYAFSEPTSTFAAISGLEKPVITKTQTNSSAAKITWSKVPYATHYQIFRVVDGEKVLLKTVTSSTLSYTDKNLESNVTYTYYVRAARNHSSSLKLYSSNTTVKLKTAV